MNEPMADPVPVPTPLVLVDLRPVRSREGTPMLIHEALARSRQREAEEAARRYRLARSLTAGRRWARLAGFASRRAARARSAAGADPLERGHLRLVCGSGSAL